MDSAMRMLVRTFCCVTLGLAILGLIGGCSSGPAKVEVTGKILNNGQPLKVSKQGEIRVKFYSEGKDAESTVSKPATVDRETGTFVVKNLPLGKYKITVQQIDPMPSTDLLERQFDVMNSKIIRDVETDGQVIEIDLAKETK